MKALTVHQPFADLIVRGPKRVENRPRAIHFRGRLAIHAGARAGAERLGYLDEIDEAEADELTYSAIVGTVEIIDCVLYDPDQGALFEDEYGLADDPHATGPYCAILRNPQRLEKPIPCRGMEGLWNVPPEIEKELDQ